jgi:hypothetical protein
MRLMSQHALWCAAIVLPLLGGCASSVSEALAPQASEADNRQASQRDGGTGNTSQVLAIAPQRMRSQRERPAPRGQRVIDTIEGAAGVTLVDQHSKQQGPQRLPVRPVSFDLDSLPQFDMPAPLDRKSAPRSLPNTHAAPLKIDKQSRSWRSKRDGDAVYVRVAAPLARLQIGTIAEGRLGQQRVYRTCGASYQRAGQLLPARWVSIDVDNRGEAVLRVTDAWFDVKTCKAAVANETEFQPAAVMGGLMFAYKSRCKDCSEGERITVIAPALTNFATSGMGGKASASHGGFSVVELPVQRGGAAAFKGRVGNHALSTWLRALKAPRRSVKSALVGVEIAQAVSDDAPLAVAYATLLR